MESLVASYGWKVLENRQNITVQVQMKSIVDQEVFILEAKCDDYKALPPYFEFIHPSANERGTKRCYPKDGSFFHETPCICVQWNRKAYKVEGGPHSDWQMTNWMSYRPGMATLGDMFHMVQMVINNTWNYQGSGKYQGRMA